MGADLIHPLDALGALGNTAAPKGYGFGTERAVPPEETEARVRPLLQYMGVTRIADVTGLDRIGIPVAVAIRPNARSLATSQGKGLTKIHARVSAMMEAAELFHAETMEQPLILATRVAMAAAGRECIDLDDSLRCARSRVSEKSELPWVETLDVMHNIRLWVPYELVHTDYRLPARMPNGLFNATSNGLASGNNLTEALISGLSEVIERDANTLFDLRPETERSARRLNLGDLPDGPCREIVEQLDAAGVACAVWDTTSDIGLATFRCLIVDREARVVRPIHAARGMGCHTRRDISFLRAVTEAAQSRLTVTTGSRDDVGRKDYARFQSPTVVDRVRALVTGTTGTRRFVDAPDHPSEDFASDLRLILGFLRGRGLGTVAVANLTRSDLGIPVVRVVVPGLEAMSEAPDYARGNRALSLLGEVA